MHGTPGPALNLRFKMSESWFLFLLSTQFFARESGCLDNDCPFLHDEEMFRERRNAVLELRREALFAPTPKQRMQHMQRIMKEERTALSMLDDLTLNDTHDDDDEDDQTEDEETKVRVPRVKHFCANSDCLKPWFRKDKGQPPLQNCAKCKWTFYCSVRARMPSSRSVI